MAPALVGVRPVLFIIGIVKVPVVTVFATEDPEINPVNPEAKIAALAGPLSFYRLMQKLNLGNTFHLLLHLE